MMTIRWAILGLYLNSNCFPIELWFDYRNMLMLILELFEQSKIASVWFHEPLCFIHESYKKYIFYVNQFLRQHNTRTRKNTCVIRNTLMRIRISEEMINKINLSKICFVYFFLHHKHKFVLWKYMYLIPEVR